MRPRTHAVYQVICDGDALESCSKSRWFENVTGDDFNARVPRAALKSRRISDNAPDAVTILQEPRNKTAADIARGPGNENQEGINSAGAMT